MSWSFEQIIKDEKVLKNVAVRSESLEILKAIEQAAHQGIDQKGKFESTNKIAEIAGISIGSLYRYFLSKEMLLKFLKILFLRWF